MQIHVKTISWDIYDVDPEKEEEILELFKTGDIELPVELYNHYTDEYFRVVDNVLGEEITPEENNGQSTVEIHKDNKIIWQNGLPWLKRQEE